MFLAVDTTVLRAAVKIRAALVLVRDNLIEASRGLSFLIEEAKRRNLRGEILIFLSVYTDNLNSGAAKTGAVPVFLSTSFLIVVFLVIVFLVISFAIFLGLFNNSLNHTTVTLKGSGKGKLT